MTSRNLGIGSSQSIDSKLVVKAIEGAIWVYSMRTQFVVAAYHQSLRRSFTVDSLTPSQNIHTGPRIHADAIIQDIEPNAV